MPIGGFGVLIENHSRDILGGYSTTASIVKSGSTSDQFGSWVQVIADVGDRDVLITYVVIYMASTFLNHKIEVEIGIGAAASESRAFGITTFHNDSSAEDSGPQLFMVNRRIPSGSRISVRLRDSSNTAHNYRVPINYIEL